ncbi:ABC transporter ATP-binding protein [Marinilabilia rubra]|uniref:ABC transporter ATP-binding protein n=1 Tax=Marinilabilia rubra TaxID=2162893 RepID=A0A2U2BBQ7_9BACT|nr:ABC transporter ATP-binding protein [Marinilabilia rubra]PWE00463.1 ABC transporter ATP-binding protein [Marinilabilia rubra]
MKNEIIEILDLKRNFSVGIETVQALKGVSFTVSEGEFITIMGASGSGKSTLLNILGALDRPTEGNYVLDGTNVGTLSKDQLAGIRNQKIGFVFQSFNLLARTSALENVELPLMYNSSVSPRKRKNLAEKALETVGLADRMDHAPNQLSGGQQQRVAIARALVNDPVMVLADEATGNLDSKTTMDIMALFQDLNRQGKTIVFVTHEHEIAEYSNRTIVLRDGEIVKDHANLGRRAVLD